MDAAILTSRFRRVLRGVALVMALLASSACEHNPDTDRAAPHDTAITRTERPARLTAVSTRPSPTSTSPGFVDPGDLYAVDLASGRTTQLTTYPGIDGAPAWMPDGQHLLFGRAPADAPTGAGDVYLLTIDGLAERRLTDTPANDETPRSSPDGDSIVFMSTRDGNPELYLLTLESSTVRRLTRDPGADRFPAFSPDGASIVFTSDRAGNEDLYSLRLADLTTRRLTDGPAPELLPAFSPDGRTIAFTTGHAIEVVDSNGSNRRTLTRDAANHPSWSPDGQRLAAVTQTGSGALVICIIDVASGSITTVTDDHADAFYPAWSPDGSTIVFTHVLRHH